MSAFKPKKLEKVKSRHNTNIATNVSREVEIILESLAKANNSNKSAILRDMIDYCISTLDLMEEA